MSRYDTVLTPVTDAVSLYTEGQKKICNVRLTVILADNNRFLYFLYHFNCERMLHLALVKLSTSR